MSTHLSPRIHKKIARIFSGSGKSRLSFDPDETVYGKIGHFISENWIGLMGVLFIGTVTAMVIYKKRKSSDADESKEEEKKSEPAPAPAAAKPSEKKEPFNMKEVEQQIGKKWGTAATESTSSSSLSSSMTPSPAEAPPAAAPAPAAVPTPAPAAAATASPESTPPAPAR